MKLAELQKLFGEKIFFSVQDVKKYFPDFSSLQLHRWQKKGYIQKITSNWYFFSDVSLPPFFLFLVSNKIAKPSYISLQSALSFYGFIPEGVFQTIAVSTQKTYQYSTPLGVFSYRKISPKLYWGYTMKNGIRIAEPEKALLDFLYLYPQYNSLEDFEELRLNIFEMQESFDVQKFREYTLRFQNTMLAKRANIFLDFFLCFPSLK